MYPFGSLSSNLAAFCASLRQNQGFRIGPRELRDASRALTLAPLAAERTVRDVLRPILAHTQRDISLFDDAFQRFFHPGATSGRGTPAVHDEPGRATGPDVAAEPASVSERADAAADAEGRTASPRGTARDVDEGDADAPADPRVRLAYSPFAGESTPPMLEPPGAALREAARVVVRRFELGLSRRWRPAPRGHRFDFRRTLRASPQTGGEPIVFQWRARPKRRPRFLMLVDASRSMAVHAEQALACGVALAGASPHVEVFVFSTTIERITRDVRRAAAGERRALPPLQTAWGGGTDIGRCLQQFLLRFGDRLLSRNTIVVMASDGLDVGDAQRLAASMSRLRRQSSSVIWLNPLVETPGYEPTASGMRAARPYVTTFTWAGDAAGLHHLARVAVTRA
jgi:uncharacterized protein with von Willebrand factor type A (vWA) domain